MTKLIALFGLLFLVSCASTPENADNLKGIEAINHTKVLPVVRKEV